MILGRLDIAAYSISDWPKAVGCLASAYNPAIAFSAVPGMPVYLTYGVDTTSILPM